MNTQKYIILFSIILFTNFCIFAQNKQKLLFCSEYWNSTQQEFVKKNKLNNIYIVYQNYILDPSTSKFDKKILKDYLDKMIPNINEKGYAVLDVEDDRFLILRRHEVKKSTYVNTYKYFINIVRYAKSLRPNIKWSFFGISFAWYDEYTSEKINKDETLIPLLKELDFLAPAMYLQDNPIEKKKTTDKFIDSNIKESIILGHRLSKPVFPFVWNRYHNVGAVNQLIELQNFKWYVNRLLDVEYKGQKINGIIWWNCESLLYRTRTKNKYLVNEFQNIKNSQDYQANLLQNYLDIIKPLFIQK